MALRIIGIIDNGAAREVGYAICDEADWTITYQTKEALYNKLKSCGNLHTFNRLWRGMYFRVRNNQLSALFTECPRKSMPRYQASQIGAETGLDETPYIVMGAVLGDAEQYICVKGFKIVVLPKTEILSDRKHEYINIFRTDDRILPFNDRMTMPHLSVNGRVTGATKKVVEQNLEKSIAMLIAAQAKADMKYLTKKYGVCDKFTVDEILLLCEGLQVYNLFRLYTKVRRSDTMITPAVIGLPTVEVNKALRKITNFFDFTQNCEIVTNDAIFKECTRLRRRIGDVMHGVIKTAWGEKLHKSLLDEEINISERWTQLKEHLSKEDLRVMNMGRFIFWVAYVRGEV